eukprot:6117673-Prymnesium_polylepis.1
MFRRSVASHRQNRRSVQRYGWCSRENRVKKAFCGMESCAAPAFEAREGRFGMTRFSRERKGVTGLGR